MVELMPHWTFTAPEIQGTTEEVAREKCRRAAELVCLISQCVRERKSENSPTRICALLTDQRSMYNRGYGFMF